MPALVNYGGDDEFYSTGSFRTNPIDLGRFYSIGSHVDIYSPPCKRARTSSPFLYGIFEPEQNKQPSIDVLPDECLFEIFRLAERETTVPVSDDVEMVSCAENGETGNNGYLTRSLEGKKATDMRLAAISVGTSGHGGLGKLVIRGSNSVRGVTNLGLSAIAHGCPSLRALSLWDVPSVGDEGLFEVAKECHSLEKLDLCNCPSISNKGLIAIAENCPNLIALNIESCPKIGNEGLQAIGKFCPKLQSISIKDCPLVGDHGVSSLLSSSTSVLTKVKLQALNITDFSLAVIGHYGKAVTNLVLSNLHHVSEKGFWVMGNAQGLQKLLSLTIFLSGNNRWSLESLQLEECNRVTQSGIVGAVSNCGKKLKALSLVKCMGIRDLASGMLGSSPCSSLRSLSIRNCPGFGSASLALVGKLCPQLQHVDLSGLCAITDSGLLPLLESCEAGLVKVNLSGCMSLTDKVVSALARLHGGTLEFLNLDGCRKITDASLMSIAENCLFLSDLDLSKCAVTDSGIAVLSSTDQLNLQVLSLSGCSEVSNKSFPFLKKLGRTLVGLNLQNCSSISSSTIELLVESLWRCDILS
ncbi:hypothetical protein GH714_041386 [Hevea brasiliensis]|uniref:F-box/LRR-repeat protein 15-like leucin rich repeat domain-containing protein n=1 Tax=Hevea brasiliensis TaxID=3981 RepID=A0A6A6MY44_HEVBR|nr:hypothetical protein GH714_041386 [Hevea brasiliensis]